MVEVVLLVLLAGGAEEVALHRVELHVDQARGVVGAFEEGAQAHEVQRLVHAAWCPRVTPRDRCERNLTHSKNWPGSRSNSPARSMRLTSSQVWFCVSQASVVSEPRTARAFSRAARRQETMDDGIALVLAP